MGITTKDKDRGAKRIRETLRVLDRSFVTIGVNKTEGRVKHPGNPSDGRRSDLSKTVAEIAFFNEFGAPGANIPERSFIRSTFDQQRFKIEALRNSALKQVLEGRLNVKKALDKIGFRMREEIKNTIVKLRTPPNVTSVAERKGANNPLIDSGLLMRSIDFKTTIKRGA